MILITGWLLSRLWVCLISLRGYLLSNKCHKLILKLMEESIMPRWRKKCITSSSRSSKTTSMQASLREACSSLKITKMINIRRTIIKKIISITKITIFRKIITIIIIRKIISLIIIMKVFNKIIIGITNNFKNKCSRNFKSNN